MRQKAKQIQEARIIWTVVHLQPPYKDNKQKLSNKHTLQIRRSTRQRIRLYTILYTTLKKTKNKNKNYTKKGDKRQNWDTRSNGDTPTLIKYLQ